MLLDQVFTEEISCQINDERFERSLVSPPMTPSLTLEESVGLSAVPSVSSPFSAEISPIQSPQADANVFYAIESDIVPQFRALPQVQAQVQVQTVEEGTSVSLEFVQKKDGEPQQVIRINAENVITNPLKRSALSSSEGRRVRPKVMRPKVIPEKGQKQCQGKLNTGTC